MARDRIFGLDVMRSAAITMVVCGHLWWLLPNKTGMAGQLASLGGFFGVELFFVLSGFLIGRILLRQFLNSDFDRKAILTFLKRRWLRTLPNYYLALILNIILALWFSSSEPNWKYIFFLQNFAWPMTPFFTESWSLSVEEFAYLILPMALFIAVIFMRRKTLQTFFAITILLILIGFLMRFHYHSQHSGMTLDYWNIGLKSVVVYRLDAIFTGVLAAILSVRFPGFWFKSRLLFLLIGILIIGFLSVGVGFLGLSFDKYQLFWNVFYLPLASFGFCCFLPFCSVWAIGGIASAPITFISKISYALYLVHYGIVLQCVKHFAPEVFGMQFLLYIFISLGLSYLMYACFEKRFLKWRDRNLPE
ncbi:acyltransferase family protein [Flavobacterium silvaticum]|uniref:Acyltransferase n=1 Tax=Flavobacterium silvaticum TaxID=1852020 RepID=A0A972FL58_9FLAO|nr:acyltransferase [Flavobacterium silvaticum]NMH28006.1 acyltransferase [Flavobacterium silvaticum]